MRKIGWGLLLVVMLVGCSEQINEIEESVSEIEGGIESIQETVSNIEEFSSDLNNFTEYSSLDAMMSDLAKNLDPASDYLLGPEEIAYAVSNYISYFEEEIVSTGMVEEFSNLRETADNLLQNEDVANAQKLIEEFELTFFEVYEAYSNK